MQSLRVVAGIALLAVLAVIAYDLHRVANALTPSVSLSTAARSYLSRNNETREQRIDREARETAERSDEMAEVLRRSMKYQSQRAQQPTKTSSH